jgi:hypothetical protein
MSPNISAESVSAATPCGVSRVSLRRRSALSLQALDRLARRLLGDAQPPADLARRGTAEPDGLHREPVRRAHVLVPPAGQLAVQLVDDRPETAEQQQRQLVPGGA